MHATLTIMRRELGAYFNTPIGYVFMVFFLVISKALYVLNSLFIQGVAEMRDYFGLLPILFLFFLPAVSMRLWSEERKLGTLELLLTFPIRTWHAVAGKFMAGMVFLAVTLFLTTDLVLMLRVLLAAPDVSLDYGAIAGGYLGALCLGMVYLAVGSFASSLTGDQIVAFVIGATLNGLLFLISFPLFVTFIRDFNPRLSVAVSRFGVGYHFDSISRGVLDSRDLLYMLSMTVFFLFLNVLVIERRR